MTRWTIYGKNGAAKAVVDTLELHDEWMAECFVTLSVNSHEPIEFTIGDYLDYRGERYTINYDPSVVKKARRDTYGEGFVYENIKFVAVQDEIVRCDFTDIVLSDNNIHYTMLPTFPFYCETVDDLLDRIQANLEELYPGDWIIISPMLERDRQRGLCVGRESAFVEAYNEYIGGGSFSYDKTGVSITVDKINCWEALKHVNDSFGLNFIVRGRVVIVGTVGMYTSRNFRYGKGNGLYELEKISDSEQRIITRMRGYGAETNLPTRFYATLDTLPFAVVDSIRESTTDEKPFIDFNIDLVGTAYWTYQAYLKLGNWTDEQLISGTGYIVTMKCGGYTAIGRVFTGYGLVRIYMEYSDTDDRTPAGVPVSVRDWDSAVGFINAVHEGVHVYFLDRVKVGAFDKDHLEGESALPDNMAINRLMLPGFPTKSLAQWVEDHDDDPRIQEIIADGFTFSDEPLRPYIDSPNKEYIGLRPGSVYFDGSNENEDIHPTMDGMEWEGKRCDVILEADEILDNGVLADDAKETDRQVRIVLPYSGFELDELKTDETTIEMKDGMCGARSLKVVKVVKDKDGNWECTCERDYDDVLHLYFPYCDFQIHAGDHYVLTGVELPKSYVDAASEKLFYACVEALRQNHAPRFTFQPRIDEIWMARQHDAATAAHQKSLHDTLKAGDIFVFTDEDLGIEGRIIIDILTIKENGNNGIPTYEVTLRDEKVTSTIEKRLDKVSSAVNAGLGGGGGYSGRQTGSLIESLGSQLFLSKIYDDEAQGLIGFLKGAWFGAKQWLIDALGNANLKNVTVNGILRALNSYINKVRSTNYSGDGMLDTGWQIINDYEGSNSKAVFDFLYIRKKAIFEELEIRKLTQLGGNFVFSPASGRAWRVELRNKKGELLGYSEVTVPYTIGGTMLSLFKKLFGRQAGAENGRYLLGRRKLVARKLTEEEIRDAYTCRVFLFNDDGTTQTMNNWTVDALARCQTFNIESQMAVVGSSWVGKKVSNTYWWRRVRGTGKATCDDGKEHYYVDFLLNRNDMSQDCDAGSDIPSVGDVFAQFGHWTQPSLANVIMIETYSGDAPAFKEYRGIGLGGWSLNGKQKTKISPTTGTVMYSTAFHIETEYGDVLVPVDRGRWTDITQERSWDMVTKQWVNDGRRCYYYDRVEHNGSTWLCTVGGTHFEDEAGNWYTEADMEGKRVEKRNYTIVEPGDATDTQKLYWQLSVSKGDKGEASFKSQVFKRTNQNIAGTVPTGGDYNNPYPGGADGTDGWYDGIPQGTETIWMSTRVFSTDGQAPQQEAWTPAQLMSDTESFDVEFSPETSPASPTDNNRHKTDYPYGYQGQVWFDPTLDRYDREGHERDFSTMLWMSERTKANGVWGEWKITKIKGEQGSFKSRVFCRSNTTPNKPSKEVTTISGVTYNTFDNPVPPPVSGQPTWTDGIPSTPAGAIIWSSVNTFDSTGDHAEWSVPVQETDTATLDIEFSPDTTCPNDPVGDDPNADNTSARNAQHWYDPLKNASTAGVDWSAMIWRAERKIANGAYSGGWTKSRIKGETGVSGAFKSRVFCRTNTNISSYTPTGGTYNEPWPTGTKDGSGKAVSDITWTDEIPNTPAGQIIWSSVATFTPSTTNPTWSHPAQETDTADLDVEFSKSTTEPDPPTGDTPHTDHSGEGWFDPTLHPTTDWTSMIWRAERKIKNGAYVGGWVVSKIKGEKGENAVTTIIYYTGPTKESVTAADIKRDYASKTWTQTAPSPTVADPMVWVGVWNNVVAGTDLNPNQTQPSSVSLFAKYGENGKSIIAVPNSIVITQQMVDGGAAPLSNINEVITIIARDGNTECTAKITSVTGTNCTASVVSSEDSTGKVNPQVKITAIHQGEEYDVNHKVPVFNEDGTPKVDGGGNFVYTEEPLRDKDGNVIKRRDYKDSGSVSIGVSATARDESTFTASLSIPFACSLLGTYMLNIVEDVKSEVHARTAAEISDDGVLTKTNYDAYYEQSAEGTIADIKKTVVSLTENGEVAKKVETMNNSINTADASIQTLSKQMKGEEDSELKTQITNTNTRVSTAEGNITNINRSVYGIVGYNEDGTPIIDVKKRDFFTKTETPGQVNIIVGEEGYQKEDGVKGIVEKYGYQNAEDVNKLINSNTKWSQYAEISQMNNAIGLSVMKMSQTIADTLVGSASSWEQGSTKDEEVGKTYEQIKNEEISTKKIRTKDTMPFYNNMKLKFTAGFEIGIHPFDADGKLLDPLWISYSSSPITLTEGWSVPTGTRQVAFVMKKTSGNDITPDEVVGNFVTAEQLRDTGIDITDGTILLKGDKVSFKDSSGNDANIGFDTSHGVYTIGGFYISQNNETGYLRDTYSYNKQDSMVHLSSKGQLYLNSNGNSGAAALVVNGATTIGGGNNPVSIGTSDTLSLNGNEINADGKITLSGTLKVSADIDSNLNIVSDTPSEIVIGVKGQTGYPDYKRLKIGWNKAYGFIKFDGIWPTEAQAKAGLIDDNVVFVDNNGYLRVRGVGGAGH